MPDLAPSGTNIAAQGNPVAPANPLQLFGQIAQLKQIQANVAQTQLQNAKMATDNLAADVASVPINPNNPDDPKVLQARMQRAAAGVATGRYGANGAQIVSQYGGQGGFTDDVTKRLAVESGDASLQSAQGMAPYQFLNTGGAITPVQPNQVLGQISMGSSNIPITMTPGEQRTPAYTTTDTQGRPGVVLKGDIPAAGQTPAPLSTNQTPVTAPLGQQAPRVTGPPAGTTEAMSQYAQGQAANALDIVQQMRNVPQQKGVLDNMRDQVGEFAPGPQSPFWQAIGSFASQFGFDPSGLNKNLGTNAAAAAEEFNKLGVFVAGQQAAQAGLMGTDAQRAQANIGSPHMTMTPLGIKRMLGVIEGNADYQNAQGQAWLKYAQSHPGVPQAQFQGLFNQRYDPRVFQFPYLDTEAQQNMLAHMTKEQRATFDARTVDAEKRGLLGAVAQ